jgi:hypothetical protein
MMRIALYRHDIFPRINAKIAQTAEAVPLNLEAIG